MSYKHGYNRQGNAHPLYTAWKAMKQRCCNPNDPAFHNYGGRGISVCKQWIDDPKAFVEWGLVNGWKSELAIDRTDNNGNYEPTNCRFVTQAVNNGNQRDHKKASGLPVGVRLNGNGFQARIYIGGKRLCLGTFDTPEKASAAFELARRRYRK